MSGSTTARARIRSSNLWVLVQWFQQMLPPCHARTGLKGTLRFHRFQQLQCCARSKSRSARPTQCNCSKHGESLVQHMLKHEHRSSLIFSRAPVSPTGVAGKHPICQRHPSTFSFNCGSGYSQEPRDLRSACMRISKCGSGYRTERPPLQHSRLFKSYLAEIQSKQFTTFTSSCTRVLLHLTN